MTLSRTVLLALTSSLVLAGCGQNLSATPSDLAAQGVSQGSAHRNVRAVDCGFDSGRGRCHAQVVVDASGAPLATATPAGYSPAQMRHAYGFDTLSAQGAGQTIAIVDAYDDPTIVNDLGVFKTQYGITGCSLSKVNQTGGTRYPRVNAGWAQEISLDVEWACAIAPQAKILLVEASSASLTNLNAAVDYAARHASVVSMSYGGGDTGSAANDAHYTVPGVSFVASSGDNGTGTSYPATSPYVLAVGGTHLPLDASGNRSGAETVWSGSGGGISTSETEPGYQSAYGITTTSGKRGSPDVAYNADPNTGVAVYDSTPSQGSSGWLVFGGTSAGAPQWSALIAVVNSGRSAGPLTTTSASTSPFYSAATGSTNSGANYTDITSGTNGTCGSVCSASTGYDLTTGVGSPRASALVPYLQSH
ncbi:subtilase family serine protease [Deinococcus metalli]|uniref:Serine protease n=1 Tax=Deinococcus metalli TaxID=1141878 RepID=A0A7W8KIB4_9DEIO|nr:S53 family peptidase [Deinococcus metalli]MBB5377708.1 subtilase family serine protease [Deinococcus metalli]GHF52727.1 serine protease [Deinococcus metalli]